MIRNDRTGRLHHRVCFALAVTLCVFSDTLSSPAQITAMAKTARRRLLVVYRNNTIPGDAEGQTSRSGGRLLRRHERFGATVVTGNSVTEQALRNDPNVDYVVEDRVISGSTLQIRPMVPLPSSNGITLLRPNAPRLSLPPGDPTDTFYNRSPQGWAVRAVGGYGGNIAGWADAGPWATSTGKGVRIAILDSGLDANHPDIAPNLVSNVSEVDQKA